MSFLKLEGLEKTYPDGTRAVRGIDLDVAEGEFIVLLGPSGCGKTTTLRMVAGLEIATGGRVDLAGRDVTTLRPSERDVGFVFQFYALYPHMRVRENIAFPLESAGMPRAERDAAVERVAERLGITRLLDKKPGALSGGDQQRISLARAMVRRPAIYLMDEPLGTLDADLRLEMCEFIRTQQLELKVTTIYVTHDQEEAMRLADRIVVIADGKILQVGTPAEVYDEPATLFVAKFVGSPGMNFVEGEVTGEAGASGGSVFRRGGFEIPLASNVRATSSAVLGVRPEYVRPESAEARGALHGEVIVDEFLGSSRCLHVQTEAGIVVARADADDPSRVGKNVAIGFDPAHTRFFDQASGDRIR